MEVGLSVIDSSATEAGAGGGVGGGVGAGVTGGVGIVGDAVPLSPQPPTVARQITNRIAFACSRDNQRHVR